MILIIVSSVIMLLITIFQFESFFESFAPFSSLIPIILLGFISFGVLNYSSLKKWQKNLFAIILTIILFVIWIFIMIIVHGINM